MCSRFFSPLLINLFTYELCWRQVRAQQPILARYLGDCFFSLAISLLLITSQRQSIYSLYTIHRFPVAFPLSSFSPSCFLCVRCAVCRFYHFRKANYDTKKRFEHGQLIYDTTRSRVQPQNNRWLYAHSFHRLLCSCLKYAARSMRLCGIAVVLAILPSQLHFIYIDLN